LGAVKKEKAGDHAVTPPSVVSCLLFWFSETCFDRSFSCQGNKLTLAIAIGLRYQVKHTIRYTCYAYKQQTPLLCWDDWLVLLNSTEKGYLVYPQYPHTTNLHQRKTTFMPPPRSHPALFPLLRGLRYQQHLLRKYCCCCDSRLLAAWVISQSPWENLDDDD
jgi:hypothetical protein